MEIATRLIEHDEDHVEEIRQRRFLKAMSLKDMLGLTDEERHELAQMIPGVDKDDGGSWKDLNPKQLGILLNFMEGFLFVTEILSQRVDSPEQ